MWKPRDQIKGVSKATQIELKALLLEQKAPRRVDRVSSANRGVAARAEKDAAAWAAEKAGSDVARSLAAKEELYERLRNEGAMPLETRHASLAGPDPISFVRESRRDDDARLEQTAETAAQRKALMESKQARKVRREKRRTEAAKLMLKRRERVAKYREQKDGSFIPL